MALRSIPVFVFNQQKMDSVLMYLSKRGQHVDSLNLVAHRSLALRQLPLSLKLSSMQLVTVQVQLQPGSGYHGLLGAAAGASTLKQLVVSGCELLDEATPDGVAASFSQLPAGLQHLSVSYYHYHPRYDHAHHLASSSSQPLQQLTYLKLANIGVLGPDRDRPALQRLQALTRIVEL